VIVGDPQNQYGYKVTRINFTSEQDFFEQKLTFAKCDLIGLLLRDSCSLYFGPKVGLLEPPLADIGGDFI